MAQLVRRSPWWVADFDPEVGRLVDRVFGPWMSPRRYGLGPLVEADQWAPACDVFTRDGDLVVRLELPGIDPDEDVRVTVEDGVLCIGGERRRAAEEDEGGYYRREWAYGSFERGIPLPDSVSVDAIKANYDNGVLEVVVPKFTALSEPKRIPVHAQQQDKTLTAGGSAG